MSQTELTDEQRDEVVRRWFCSLFPIVLETVEQDNVNLSSETVVEIACRGASQVLIGTLDIRQGTKEQLGPQLEAELFKTVGLFLEKWDERLEWDHQRKNEQRQRRQ